MKRIPPGKQLSSLPKKEWKEFNPTGDRNTFFPRSISFEDIDKAVFDWFNTRDIIINDKKVPAIFLTPEKWAEVKKSWSDMNKGNHNIQFPYITVRRSQSPRLADAPTKGRVPGKTFTTYKVPVYTSAGPTYKLFKVPQPVKVDLEYEVRALTHYISDINLINEMLLRHFASLQAYLSIDNHYMPMIIDSVSDESDLDAIEDERVMHTLYNVTVRGYIIDEKEFEELTATTSLTVQIDEEI